MEKFIAKAYSTMEASDIFSYLDSSARGLQIESAKQRLRSFGKNTLPKDKKRSRIVLFFQQFNSPLVYIILVTAVISISIGHHSDAFFIMIVVMINTIVGFFQEDKAERALAALQKSLSLQAVVVREGRPYEIAVEEIVVGDVVRISAGDYIAADGRIIHEENLSTNESVLTGESESIAKDATVLETQLSIGDRTNMLFAGSYVATGDASYIVTETGRDTELGKIAALVRNQKQTKEPLQEEFAKLSRIIGASVLVAISFFAFIGLYRGQTMIDVFITSTALVVSAVPEGLLPAVTMVMVFGVRRLATKRALVRRLSATETIGAITTICSDKTGTLTQGEMQARSILDTSARVHDIVPEDRDVSEEVMRILCIASLVNDAFVEKTSDNNTQYIVRGRSTDRALLNVGLLYEVDNDDFLAKNKRIANIAFSSQKKFASNLYKKHGTDESVVMAIGAPENILERTIGVQKVGGDVYDHDTQEAKDLMSSLKK